MDSSSSPDPTGTSVIPAARTSRLAIASLVLGLIPCCTITGIAGVVCGFKARDRIRSGKGALSGEGLARAGIILSVVMILCSFPVLAGMIIPGVASGRERARSITSLHKLKAIAEVQRTWTARNGGKLPPALWTTALSQNGGMTNVSLSGFEGKVGYAYNIALAGLNASDVPSDTVLFFETEQKGSNLCGGRDMLRRVRLKTSRISVVFIDGSARLVKPDQTNSLRWNPS